MSAASSARLSSRSTESRRKRGQRVRRDLAWTIREIAEKETSGDSRRRWVAGWLGAPTIKRWFQNQSEPPKSQAFCGKMASTAHRPWAFDFALWAPGSDP